MAHQSNFRVSLGQDMQLTTSVAKMEKTASVPILLSFKRVNLLENLTPTHKNLNDVIDGKRPSPVSEISPKKTLPLISFSLCSILTRRNTDRKSKTPMENEEKKVMIAVNEINRFEKDFVFPMLKTMESDKSCLGKSCTGISIVGNKDKMFYSSTSSIQTDTDSGAFSRLSSPDTDSDQSDLEDSSIVINHDTKEFSDTYSDDDIDEGLEKDNTSSLKSLQIHHSNSKKNAKIQNVLPHLVVTY